MPPSCALLADSGHHTYSDIPDQVEGHVVGSQHLSWRASGEVACPLRRVLVQQRGGPVAPFLSQVCKRADVLLGPSSERGLSTELDDGRA